MVVELIVGGGEGRGRREEWSLRPRPRKREGYEEEAREGEEGG